MVTNKFSHLALDTNGPMINLLSKQDMYDALSNEYHNRIQFSRLLLNIENLSILVYG